MIRIFNYLIALSFGVPLAFAQGDFTNPAGVTIRQNSDSAVSLRWPTGNQNRNCGAATAVCRWPTHY